MSVISISKIQVRRGKKNQGSGLPQLASGEFGWAVDTQELFIGNGSVAEGAPAVGNTKILTEHDDLFNNLVVFLDNLDYTYKKDQLIQTGISLSDPTIRTLQDRLDDIVNVRNFGALGDGSDQTAQLQRAIDQLYINPSTRDLEKSRVILYLDPGVYTISNSIFLPPFVRLEGAGIDKTIIKQVGNFPAFITVNGLSEPNNPADYSTTSGLNQSRNIEIRNLTIDMQTFEKALVLNSCKDSIFENLFIKSVWFNGVSGDDQSLAIEMNSLSTLVNTSRNHFTNIKIDRFKKAIQLNENCQKNYFTECLFSQLQEGIMIDEIQTQNSVGASHTVINKSEFRNIDRYGIWVKTGENNSSSSNNFFNVGNNGGGANNPTYSIIRVDQPLNFSRNDWFDRTFDLSINENYFDKEYVPEIQGLSFYEIVTPIKRIITGASINQTVFRLPGNVNKTFLIEYFYENQNESFFRKGTLDISVDKELAFASITDDYEYFGVDSPVDFVVNYVDVNGDGELDTVNINAVFPKDIEFSFTIKSKSG